jgi:hypothetical protein
MLHTLHVFNPIHVRCSISECRTDAGRAVPSATLLLAPAWQEATGNPPWIPDPGQKLGCGAITADSRPDLLMPCCSMHSSLAGTMLTVVLCDAWPAYGRPQATRLYIKGHGPLKAAEYHAVRSPKCLTQPQKFWTDQWFVLRVNTAES